jgi:hypothetical protein
MNCSRKRGRLRGATVYLPWLVAIVPSWVALTAMATGAVLALVVGATIFIFAALVCVAAVARRKGSRGASRTADAAAAGAESQRDRVIVLPAHARAADVARALFTSQNYFPVLQDREVVGVISKGVLLRALANSQESRLVAEMMIEKSSPGFAEIDMAAPLRNMGLETDPLRKTK